MNVLKASKKGKACVPDNISAEHLQYAHPSLVVHIKLLAQLIIKHGYVPDGFGLGLIVPLVKDKSGNLSDSNNYRASPFDISLTYLGHSDLERSRMHRMVHY